MVTTDANVRPELSKKNKYYISKHRYYELKHLCLQYTMFKKENPEDNRARIIEQAAKETNNELSDYILLGVTVGYSYNILRVRYSIPCCQETYYNLYRKFFWLLDQARC